MASTTPTFSASTRTVIGKQVGRLRRDGQLPAVVYGHKKEARALSVDAREFHKLYEESGSTSLINLKIDDGSAIKVLIHDVQVDPARRLPLHVDFYQVNLKEKLQTEIPLQFTGISAAVENEEGTLNIAKDAVEVECLPDKLVHEIEVDITSLATFDDVIRVSDIAVPEGITILNDADEMVASVIKPISAEALEELEEKPEQAEVESETGGEEAAESETSEE